jgi:uncharacterized protein (TIGR02246 family)
MLLSSNSVKALPLAVSVAAASFLGMHFASLQVEAKEKAVLATKAKAPSKADIIGLGEAWGKALASRDSKNITALYAPEAVLLATFSNELDTPQEISNYFVGLTKKPDLKVKFEKQNVKVFDDNTASNSGLYTFSFTEKGKTVSVPARYTFTYEKINGKWSIVEHHSSLRPETAAK